MTKRNILKISAAVPFLVLTVSFLLYLFDSYGYYSYAHSMGAQDIESLRSSYFSRIELTPLVKYCIWPLLFLFTSLPYLFKLRQVIIGLLYLVLSIWLFISILQQYYAVFSFGIVFFSGVILELTALTLFSVMLFKKSANQ